jgi:orotidine-5'-phosphate decarboxylase
MAAKDKIIFALDVANADEAAKWVSVLKGRVGFFKIGLELFTAAGPDVVGMVKEAGIKVFLDLKFHDIPNTVAGAVRSAVRLGVDMMTLHLSGGRAMIAAGVEAAREESANLGIKRPKIIGVSVLTSLGDNDMKELGFRSNAVEQVMTLLDVALKSGADGMVCSAADLDRIKPLTPKGFTIITPGIRPAGADKGDQSRIAAPASAIKGGSSLLVIGRPISAATDPLKAVELITSEIETAS